MCIGCVIVYSSCNRYLMLINHPTDGTTRGLTSSVRLLGRNLKKRFKKKIYFGQIYFYFILAKKFVKRTVLIRSNAVH